MTLKLLDIQYLKTKEAPGKFLIVNSSQNVSVSSKLIDSENSLIVESTNLQISNSNVHFSSSSNGIVFGDGSYQTTAAISTPPAGIENGVLQYKSGNVFASTSNLKWDISNNRLGINQSIPKTSLQIRNVGYDSTPTVITSGITPIIIDSFDVTDFRSCHYIVQVTDQDYSFFHTTQIMIVHNGINVYKSEYNIVVTQDKLGNFDCDISLGKVNLIFTPFYTSNKSITAAKCAIAL